jgi:hypothetical protein
MNINWSALTKEKTFEWNERESGELAGFSLDEKIEPKDT